MRFFVGFLGFVGVVLVFGGLLYYNKGKLVIYDFVLSGGCNGEYGDDLFCE